MIEAVVVVPSPPMLLPEYVGLQDPAAPIRQRCVDALAAALHEPYAVPDVVVIVSGRARASRTTRRPLGVRIGRHLLRLAGWAGPVEEAVVDFDADGTEVEQAGGRLAAREGRVLLLVVGDGSARRGEKAPGHLDDRAATYDAALLAALDRVDPQALIALDAGLGKDLLATGRAALQVMAHAVRGSADLQRASLWSDDPYGVLYAVAVWTSRAPTPS